MALTLSRLLRMAFAQRRAAVIALAAQIIQIGLSLILPLFLKNAVDNGLESGDYSLIVLAAVETFGVSVVRSFVWYFVTYYYRVMATAVGFDLRDSLYEKLQRNRLTFHLKSHSGDLFALTATDVQAIEDFLNNGLNQAVQHPRPFGIAFRGSPGPRLSADPRTRFPPSSRWRFWRSSTRRWPESVPGGFRTCTVRSRRRCRKTSPGCGW